MVIFLVISGWTPEQIEDVATGRLRSLRALREDLCAYMMEMRNSEKRCRQLSIHDTRRVFYAGKVCAGLGVLGENGHHTLEYSSTREVQIDNLCD
jgi:hypothetical protein